MQMALLSVIGIEQDIVRFFEGAALAENDLPLIFSKAVGSMPLIESKPPGIGSTTVPVA